MPLVQFSLGVGQGCTSVSLPTAGGWGVCAHFLWWSELFVVAEVRPLWLTPAVKHPATALGRPLCFLVLKTVALGLWD